MPKCLYQAMNNEERILKDLVRKLECLLQSEKDKKKQIATGISNYCTKALKRYKVRDEVEEILTACLTLNHWGWKELPPRLTLTEIRKDFLPEVKSLLKELHKKIKTSP